MCSSLLCQLFGIYTMWSRAPPLICVPGSLRGSTERFISTIRTCIVGAGPAGYYTAQRLLKHNDNIHIDMIDRLPVPFGLVRFGVAPDHPEVKNVINTFTQTATTYKDRCRFVGNVEVGRDIHVSQLQKLYDVVVLSYGAEDDRKLGIAGEECEGVYSAREFVGWYNGVPEFAQLQPNLTTAESAVILGQGNVALDIARLLLMPIDQLAKTDICQHALDVIAASSLSSIHIVGRRGPLQAAFTIKEFREMTKLPDANGCISSSILHSINISELPRPRRRLTELMQKIAASNLDSEETRAWHLHFLLTPQEILTSSGHVSALKCARNRLEGDEIASQKAVQTDETTEIPCDLVIRSIGYHSPLIDEHVPFDTKTSTIPNVCGRVNGRRGMYCSGWVKRGPVGVIATTMADAFETADSILEDVDSGLTNNQGGFSDWITDLGKETVNFAGWEKIDEEEVQRGKTKEKPREKLVNVDEMLRVAKD